MNRDSFAEKYIKPLLRFIYYKNQRAKVFREIKIRREQDISIKTNFQRSERNLIVFLIPGADWKTGKDSISGGVLSIASIYQETEKLFDIHGSKLMMCTFPSDHLLFRHYNFENNITIYRFDQLLYYFQNVSNLVIHIPELFVKDFKDSLSENAKNKLKGIPNLHINILNQNIRLMPTRMQIDSIRDLTEFITSTTAHAKYCTSDYKEQYGIPLHFLSTFASPEDYHRRTKIEKKDLLLLSPDDEQKNQAIISLFRNKLPGTEVKVIQGLKYNEYKNLINEAKWSITFGEGLDFYFIEPVFSGAISFAIYNELFFTPDFSSLETIYPTYELLFDSIISDIIKLNSDVSYKSIQDKEYDLCAKYYSKDQYRKNIAAFYRKEYTYG